MKFSCKTGSPAQEKADCIAVGVFEDHQLSASAQQIDKASEGLISRLLKRGDFDAKAGSSFLISEPSKLQASRLLLVGLGKKEKLDENSFNRSVIAMTKAFSQTKAKNLWACLLEVPVKKRSLEFKLRQAMLAAAQADYCFDQFKEKKATKEKTTQEIIFHVETKERNACQKVLSETLALIEGIVLTKNLGNLPSNICTPTYLANTAKKLAKTHTTVTTKVFSGEQIKKMGMGAFYGVSQGSHEPPQFICMEYAGTASAKKSAPIVLVGKGITFDTGGISIKPSGAMDEMKYDMCGAASVLGTITALAEMKAPVHVIGLIAATENMPGGGAQKPGDIVTTLSGKTVEVLDTDAEGRLVLCDLLTYATRYKPKVVVDIATLTGAVVVALGQSIVSGFFTRDEHYAQRLSSAADNTWDRVWRLPLMDDYQPLMDSPFADVANIGSTRYGGSITAACFLERFVEDNYPWIHIDIAGTAWGSGKDKAASGRPVALLTEFVLENA